MPLPHAVARFNKRYTNRFLEPVVRRSSGFAVIHHRGRRTGVGYETPVNVFWLDGDVIVALTYGPRADWVRNTLAGQAAVSFGGRHVVATRHITRAEVVGRSESWPALPPLVRSALRLLGVHHFLRLSLAPVDTSR